MKQSPFRKILIISVAVLTVILAASCPQEVTAPMVALVEDSLVPTITITSPNGGDYYYSSVTVSGILSDDVQVEGDAGGQISSLYYEIANDDFRKGKIDIGLDDQITADTEYGSGTIDYDIITGEFEFTFSTTSPSELRDLVSVTITAVDRNNNVYIEELNLYENEGPFIEFGFYNSSSDYENVDSRVTSTSSDGIYISGTVANSEDHTTSADEIALLSWQLEGTAYSGSLDLSADSSDLLESGTFSSLNTDGDNNFFYDPSTRRFSTYTEVDLDSGSKIITLAATDLFGHETEVQETLSPPATLALSSIDADVPYYSTVQADNISISSKLSDPNDLILNESDVVTISYSFTAAGSALFDTNFVAYDYNAADGDYNEWYENDYGADDDYEQIDIINTFNNGSGEFFDESGNFTINLNTKILLVADASTSVIMKITAEDFDGNEVSKKVILEIDNTPPVINDLPMTATGGKVQNSVTYLNSGDQITLNFSIEDSLAGITGLDNITSVSIGGEDLTGTVSYNGGGSFSVNFPLSDADIADEAELSYSISTVDNVGNTSSTGTVADNTLVYYHAYTGNEPSISWSSSNSPSYQDWARADDTVTGTITGSRVLSTNSTINVANLGAVGITSSAPYTSTSTALSDAGLGENSDITYSVDVEDAAGNTAAWTGDTLINYDGTPPGLPDDPIWEGTNALYITKDDMTVIVSMKVNYLSDTANTGDTVELYLDSSSGTLLGTTPYNDLATSVDVEVNKTNLRPDGPKNIIARIVDPAGNYSSDTAPLEVTLDEDPPDVSFDSTPANALNSGFTINSSDGDYTYTTSSDTAEYTWSVTDSGGAVVVTNPGSDTFKVNGSSSSISLSTSAPNADDDDYIVTLSVTDAAGNPCETAATFSFTWDTTMPEPPETPVWEGTNAPYITKDDMTGTVSMRVDYSSGAGDDGDTVELYLDSSSGLLLGTFPYNDSATSVNVEVNKTNLRPDGSKDIIARIVDPAGNFSSDTAPLEVILDEDPPDVSFDSTPANALNSGFTINSSDGDYTYTTSSDTAEYTWSVTDSGGAVVVTNPGSDTFEVNGSSPSITLDTSAAHADDDDYIITLSVIDAAGNPCETAATFTFTWDTTPPTVSFDSEPAIALNSGFTINSSGGDYTYTTSSDTAEYTWSVTDSGGAVAVTNPGSDTFKVNGSSSSISLSTSAPNADDDDYIVTLSVTDAAGNPCETAATFSFTWDTTPPDSPDEPIWEGTNAPYITKDDMTGTVSMRVDYSSGAGDDGDTVELYLDSSSGLLLGTFPYNDSATSVNVEVNKTNLRPDGPKDIIARIVDPAGNFSSDTATLEVTLDEDPPDVSFDSTPENALNSGFTIKSSGGDYAYTTSSDTAEYAWSVTDSGGAVVVTNPGSDTFEVNGSSPSITLDTSAAHADDDDYIITLSVIDAAGNPCETAATFTFTWDTTAPVINSITPSGGDGTNLVFTADIDESNPATYTWTLINVTAGNTPVSTDDWSAPANILTLTTYTDATQYRADLTITDECGYSDSDFATSTTSGAKALLLSNLSQNSSSGGSSSSSSGSSSRINTYNFDSAESANAEPSDSAEPPNTTTSNVKTSASPSQSYSGSLYSPPARTPGRTAETTSGIQDVSVHTKQEKTSAVAAADTTAEQNVTNEDEWEAEYINAEDAHTVQLDTTFEAAERGTMVSGNINKLSSKASAAVAGRQTVKPPPVEINEETKKSSALPAVIILLLGGSAAGIIIRKRRI